MLERFEVGITVTNETSMSLCSPSKGSGSFIMIGLDCRKAGGSLASQSPTGLMPGGAHPGGHGIE